jgi:putative DNA primase/helicase
MTKPINWYASRYAERFGMALIPIKTASKLPLENDWGNCAITDATAAGEYWTARPELNIGLALGPSNMCSLDIDCMDSFRIIALEFGIDLDLELAKVPTIQGADKGMRCMFRVPASPGVMDYHKISWPSERDPSGDIHRQMMRDAAKAKTEGNAEKEQELRATAKQFSAYTVLELRVSNEGKQRYDVLPPSIHPDTGKPYRWIVQPPSKLEDWPEPPAWMMAIWNAWDSFKPQLIDACPWIPKAPPPTAKKPSQAKTGEQGPGAITAFNEAHDLRMVLEQYGYTRKGKSRYLSPHTTTNLPGVVLFPDEDRCFIHHASDPLCSDDSGKPVNAFDLYCEYEHSGDISKAVKAAAELLGLKHERKKTPQAKAVIEDSTPVDKPEPTASGPMSPFRCLGYNGNGYYYLPRGTEQVSEIRKGSHTSPAELMGIAPLEWWEMAFPKGDKGGIDWHSAANDCMRGCERRGIYSSDRERGRGAWYDTGRAVLHLGNRLLVDGEQVSISDHKTNYIYTRQAPLEHGADAEPATDETAIAIAEMFEQLNWNKPVYAQMLAGWCLLAPICGSLSWRPHVWLTAQRGAGKSWVQDHMIEPLLGPAAMMVQGSTTEAGLRQRLKSDSRPIVFDEAESEDHRSAGRMQTVIELARQSSSDSTAEIVKGTVNGQGMSFRMRSMFLLGSVNVSLSQAADESRFSVLSLASPEKSPAEAERFDTFSKRVDNTLTPEICASIRARAYKLMPVIRVNAKTFARAVAEILGSQRIGDQVGTLIAGACAYHRTDEISLDDARKWVSDMDFSDAKEAEQVSDEESCLQRILQSQVRFDSERGSLQRSIGEVIDAARGAKVVGGMTSLECNDVLKRYGLAVDGSFLVVANKHVELQKLLTGTPWGSGWRRILGRISGAEATENPYRFAGTLSRSVRIPINFIG